MICQTNPIFNVGILIFTAVVGVAQRYVHRPHLQKKQAHNAVVGEATLQRPGATPNNGIVYVF
jgi:hypothetical protein